MASTLNSVASVTANTVNAAWKRDNRFAHFTVTELSDNKFSVRATGVTATQAPEPLGLPAGVSLVGQRSRAPDTPGATGFVWEGEYVWRRPFTQWLSEIIANAFVRIAVFVFWMAVTLAATGFLCFVGYLAIGIVKSKFGTAEIDGDATPFPPVPCATPSATRVRHKPPDVISPNDVPIEECRGETCHLGPRRN